MGGGWPPSELKPVAMCHWLTQLCPPPPASEDGSESEGSESSGRSCPNEHSIQEKLQVLMAEGLLPAVKVFLDWLRTNPDLIVVCAQVSLQPHRPSSGPGASARLGRSQRGARSRGSGLPAAGSLWPGAWGLRVLRRGPVPGEASARSGCGAAGVSMLGRGPAGC